MKRIVTSLALGIALSSTLVLTGCQGGPITQANAASASAGTLTADSRSALRDLYSTNSAARRLGQTAAGVLVFPSITKGGFVVGGQGGNGTLFYRDGRVGGYYQTVGLSYGLQAGIQKYGYALFLMDRGAFASLNASQGWEVGGAPSLVVVDEGISTSLSTTTVNEGVYAFFFNQTGLMAGLGLQGTKITRIHPGN